MQWMDIAAGISAGRYCRMPVVTAAVDELIFNHPIRMADVVMIRACVNFTGRTSMEVGVRVEREDAQTGDVKHCLTGYFTFVAIDEAGRPVSVPPIEPQTDDEKRRYAKAKSRRERRLQSREGQRRSPPPSSPDKEETSADSLAKASATVETVVLAQPKPRKKKGTASPGIPKKTEEAGAANPPPEGTSRPATTTRSLKAKRRQRQHIGIQETELVPPGGRGTAKKTSARLFQELILDVQDSVLFLRRQGYTKVTPWKLIQAAVDHSLRCDSFFDGISVANYTKRVSTEGLTKTSIKMFDQTMLNLTMEALRLTKELGEKVSASQLLHEAVSHAVSDNKTLISVLEEWTRPPNEEDDPLAA